MESDKGFNINELVQAAKSRWLRPAEVHFILQNHESYELTDSVPQKPPGGSLFLYNKRVLRYFRKDGHDWRKKKTGKTVGEGHEKLRVGDVEALNCYYAHGEQDPKFQRRSYWMLDPAYEHIALVHYRDTGEERHTVGLTSHLSPSCSSALTSCIYTPQNQSSISAVSELYNQHPCSFSPGSLEVSSEYLVRNNGMNNSDGTYKSGELNNFRAVDAIEKFGQLEEQLNMKVDTSEDSGILEYERMYNQGGRVAQQHGSNKMQKYQCFRNSELGNILNSSLLPEYSGEDTVKHEEAPLLKEIFQHCQGPAWTGSTVERNVCPNLIEQQEILTSEWLDLSGTDAENRTHEANLDCYKSSSDQENQFGVYVRSDSAFSLKQRFSIREISPEWGYASESTKVMICGSFLCDTLESAWKCLFGDIEAPLQIIQEGVFSCQAPPQSPGKVTLCISSSNREPCSEIREFEYRTKPISSLKSTKSTEELISLIRFAQMLLCDQLVCKEDTVELFADANEDPWGHMIEGLLIGTETQPTTMDWILKELLKDKLQKWLLSKSHKGDTLSKKEKGIIHLVAGLGFEWALVPILDYGININFRDFNGWTALHWAARFEREKMVSALIAAGASTGAVTDPTSEDPVGKTPGCIAAAYGHTGLAGFLSEMSLTSHLYSLTLEESEISKGSAVMEAERTVERISEPVSVLSEDQSSLQNSLDAVRNAAQAAARIQFAFREHSFRRRQLREAAIASCDEHGITPNDILGISAASKLTSRQHDRKLNKSALCIQKKYRGWKWRQNFLDFRQKVVMIQAHVRGYQVRRKYKVILWAVGVLEKVVLRWRRKGDGLRGFKAVPGSDGDSEYEDIIKVFRKKKVDVTIEEALSRVVSMVKTPEARKQYRRMLQSFREAKAGLLDKANETASTSQGIADMMDKDMEDFISDSIGTILDDNTGFLHNPNMFRVT
ncbi:hypothetical protein GIB67_009370 [Kingdonia uniflora]|uniref:CG-1 domain-containing protein n=1 Tax=Kingdonia uniflora TaxID=39325 RepID=A0A7J7N2Q6_9MAGN|nr:hypothetical protein GIB67_009370 [Kingdonia uniflora]